MVKILSFCLFFSCVFLFSGTQDQKIKTKKEELSELRNEILELEKELQGTKQKEKQTYETIEKINKKTFLLNKLINSLREEEEQKSLHIENTSDQISILEKQTKLLKDMYARYIVSHYKTLHTNKYSYLFDASSMHQAFLRYQYLKLSTNQGKKDLDHILENKNSLLALNETLWNEKKEKEELIASKVTEERSMTKSLLEKKEALKKTRKDKTSLSKEIETKRQAQRQIEKLIAKLIELEKKKPLPEKKTTKDVPNNKPGDKTILEDYPVATANAQDGKTFQSMRGRLYWPVSSGKIIRGTGEQKNAKLNTITINFGIDIKLGSDLSVRTVADGVISVVDWIPGYGTVLIVSHGSEYRTVYGHLSEVSVKEGARIKAGDKIGTIGESLEGNVFHFEIWKDRQYQNPEIWLAHR